MHFTKSHVHGRVYWIKKRTTKNSFWIFKHSVNKNLIHIYKKDHEECFMWSHGDAKFVTFTNRLLVIKLQMYASYHSLWKNAHGNQLFHNNI